MRKADILVTSHAARDHWVSERVSDWSGVPRRICARGRSRLIELTENGGRLHKKALPLWRKAQRKFEQLNGVENVTALRKGLAKMTVGDVAT